MIVVPDADVDSTAKGLLASSMGSAGQRCMAASVAVGVEDVDHIIEQLIKEANQFKLGIDMGTIISKASLNRITNYINEAEKMGAKVLLDGRKAKVPSEYNSGYWIGPTILDYVNPDWACATDEIFGPVLSIIRVPTIEKAMEIDEKPLVCSTCYLAFNHRRELYEHIDINHLKSESDLEDDVEVSLISTFRVDVSTYALGITYLWLG